MITFRSIVQLKSSAEKVESNVSGVYFSPGDKGLVLNPSILELPEENGERNTLVTIGFTRNSS